MAHPSPFTQVANLKRKVRQHLKCLGFTKRKDGTLDPPDTTKDTYRYLHRLQWQDKLHASEPWLETQIERLRTCFAEGAEVDPENIRPEIEEIHAGNTKLAYLFRLASLTWSVPVSNGYGRRMRFLVWDRNNGKLIGLIALGDPVFNMAARDKIIGWTTEQRADQLVNMMDAFVLGAIPPYNQLLCGKLLACLVRTKEIAKAFEHKYSGTTGIISGQKKHAKLLCVSTTSALGRSSTYNRLKLNGTQYFKSIGFTGGWGHFQIPDSLFSQFRQFLRRRRHKYANGHRFGQGPNWRIRVTRVALERLGLKSDILRHNLQREVFLCTLADNAVAVLKGTEKTPKFTSLRSVDEVATMAKKRWIIPRSLRRPEFRLWTVDQTLRQIKFGALPARNEKTLNAAAA